MIVTKSSSQNILTISTCPDNTYVVVLQSNSEQNAVTFKVEICIKSGRTYIQLLNHGLW